MPAGRAVVTDVIIEQTGWLRFFLLCAVLALPGMFLLLWMARWRADAVPSTTGK